MPSDVPRINLTTGVLERFVTDFAGCNLRFERNAVRVREMAKEILRLRGMIESAGDLLFQANPLDPEHEVKCHADTLPQAYLRLALLAQAAANALQDERLHDLMFPAEKIPEQLKAENAQFRALFTELLRVVDAKDKNGEPQIGGDHTGAVNWLLDFADKVRPIVEEDDG